MKLLRVITTVFAILVIVSCGDANEKETEQDMVQEIRDPAESNKEWIAAWNNNDPEMLKKVTAADAILLMQGESKNRDSIDVWLSESVPMMKNLRTTAQMSNHNDSIAYEAGTYVHSMQGDSLNTEFEGVYTIIWERANDDWQVKLMNITQQIPDSTYMKEE